MSATTSATTDEAVAAAAPATNPTLTLAVLALASLAYSLLQSVVSPALPTIQHAVGASESGITWLMTGYLLSAAVATPIIGRLGDVHGKRRMLIVSLLGLATGTLITAVGNTLALLIAGRVIQGLGGGVFPLAFGIIRDEFPRERVPGSIGLVSALLGLGGGVGVVLAGLIVQGLGYHWLFWIPLVAILVATAATVLVIPESPTRAPVAINWGGAALMSVGLAAVLLAISQTTSWGWGSPKTLGLIAAGCVVLAAWVWSEQRARSPLVDMRMMRIRGVWTTNVVAVLIGMGMFTGFVIIPQFVQTPASAGFGFGSSVTGAGAFLLPMSLVMLGVGIVAGRIEARVGSKVAVITGAAFSLLAFICLLVAHDSKGPIYVASGLLGVGIGLAFAAMANLIVQSVSATQTGVATGMNTVARSLGGAFGAQLAATFLTTNVTRSGMPTVGGFNDAFLLGAVACLLAIVMGAAIPSHLRSRRIVPVRVHE